MKIEKDQGGASGASLRSAPSAPGYFRGSFEKDQRGALGASLPSAPSAPGYLNGAFRPTFHTAMKSLKKRSARSAEKN